MITRIYYKTLGGHVHMRVFVGNGDSPMGKAGDLCMRVDEFCSFKSCTPAIQYRHETTEAAQ